ncbi:hypothetical protein PPACK8108_LOCUS15067 [Phakopsora pachyrhizi]|uniref:Uncharacterized protein n=1 Tax=Phakopsora pachyrhizi TaxID=170000 RepID=A0AAV0B986_PHAPC|nr:hypothetical protein PPACK8108_LOCUS15067 [Phakopsora pachyrhizi]
MAGMDGSINLEQSKDCSTKARKSWLAIQTLFKEGRAELGCVWSKQGQSKEGWKAPLVDQSTIWSIDLGGQAELGWLINQPFGQLIKDGRSGWLGLGRVGQPGLINLDKSLDCSWRVGLACSLLIDQGGLGLRAGRCNRINFHNSIGSSDFAGYHQSEAGLF